MNLNMHTKLKKSVDRFLTNLGLDAHSPGFRVLANGSEDLIDDLARGRKPKLHGMAGGVVGRLEENYLYYTRRFPQNTANNTIGAGAVAAGDYGYFSNGIGDPGSSAGYFSIANLTLQQTNMASAGKIPSGRAFKLFDMGVSFNAGISPGDAAQLMDIMNLRFEKQNGQLVIQHGPIKLWPGGTGPYGFAATTATTTTIAGASNGMPALTNARRLRTPREFKPNDSFQYIINAAATLPKDNATVALSAFTEVTLWLFGQIYDQIPA